jgi:hypothetical protein
MTKFEKVVETRMMREIVLKTLSLHPCGVFVWHGGSAIGKTVTARYLIEKINHSVLEAEESAFLARHYEVGLLRDRSCSIKRSIKSLYEGSLHRRLDESIYRTSTAESLATILIDQLQADKIEMILVDGADCLSAADVRGMLFVYKIARSLGQALSIVFIGTDSLPAIITSLSPIFTHVTDWSYFREYNLEETWKILAALHPHFRALDKLNPDDVSQVRFIHEKIGGYPGCLVSFLKRLNYFSKLND